MKQDERRQSGRYFLLVFGAVQLALVASGLLMLFTREPDSGATRIANRGLQASPSPATGLQDLHESTSLLMLIVVIIGGGWLMVRVKQDWSGRLALVLLATAVAAVTGMLVRFETVRINGVFVEDLRGMGFLFDGAFEQIGFGKRSFGATAYRVLVALHLVAAASMMGAAISGVRDIVRVPTA